MGEGKIEFIDKDSVIDILRNIKEKSLLFQMAQFCHIRCFISGNQTFRQFCLI